LAGTIDLEATLSNAANQWGDAKRGPFWGVLYGSLLPREFWVHVIAANEERQIAYSGPDFGETLKTALAEAALHKLPVTYRLWARA
jgi:hypothetical protein